MHLQVTGRLDPGESYATIDLDATNILPRGQFLTLELVNIIICRQEDHSHFEEAQRAEYPEDPSRYPESLTVRRPRPQPLTFRRRTALHDPHLEVPTAEAEPEPAGEAEADADEELQRERRQVRPAPAPAPEEEEELTPLGEMEMEYSASFRYPIFEFEIANFRQLSLDSLIERVLQGKQGPLPPA